MRVRRAVTTTTGALLLLTGFFMMHQAEAGSRELTKRERQCRFQWVDKAIWTQREELMTMDCVLARWPVPGGKTQFDNTISCESGWNRFAYNPNGPYLGLGQHLASAWYSRVKSYEPRWWDLKPNWRNSRTQITVTARMMRAQGLSPWSCA